MKDSTLYSFKESPVEMTVGIIVLVCGLFLTVQQGWTRFLGPILTAVSSFLVSWTMAAVKERAVARVEFTDKLTQLGTHLATISGQLVEAVRSVEIGESESETAFARVRDSAANLFGLIQQIEEQSGREVSSVALIQNAERLMELTDRMRDILSIADSESDDELQEIGTELHEVHSEIEAVAERHSDRPTPRPIENASCPYCSKLARFPLGERKGDSAMPTCNRCGKKFHAHRQNNGEIFTRKHGSYRLVSLKDIDVACPSCQRSISLRAAKHDDELKVRFCMTCYTRLTIDPVEESVIRHHEDRPIKTRLIESSGSTSLLLCLSCNREVTSFMRSGDGTIYAVCHRCDPPRLLSATESPGAGKQKIEDIFREVDRLKDISLAASVNYLKSCIGEQPENPDLHQVLGACLRKWAVEFRERGDEENAKKYLDEAITAHNQALTLEGKSQRSDNTASIYYAKGRALGELGNNEEAELCYRKALDLNPGHEKAKMHLQASPK